MAKLIAFLLTMLFVATPDTNMNGTVRGSVKDAATGELLPMSLVYFYPMGTGGKPRFIQTSSGNFTIVEIPPGPYLFFVRRVDYRPLVAQQIEVKAGTVTELNFVLQHEKTRADSTDVVYPGEPGVDYKMRYLKPHAKKYR
jgi:hypothetical protein